ncbi:MAG TPA: hypothetical protein DCZ72_15575 [Armatimonadetes bacterium]|nr:hypothetical protein [Armatimonadota bacterium]
MGEKPQEPYVYKPGSSPWRRKEEARAAKRARQEEARAARAERAATIRVARAAMWEAAQLSSKEPTPENKALFEASVAALKAAEWERSVGDQVVDTLRLSGIVVGSVIGGILLLVLISNVRFALEQRHERVALERVIESTSQVVDLPGLMGKPQTTIDTFFGKPSKDPGGGWFEVPGATVTTIVKDGLAWIVQADLHYGMATPEGALVACGLNPKDLRKVQEITGGGRVVNVIWAGPAARAGELGAVAWWGWLG